MSTSTLKVKVIEEGGFLDGALFREHGDVFSSPNGQVFVDAGWCEDYETGLTGTRIEGAKSVVLQEVITRIS